MKPLVLPVTFLTLFLMVGCAETQQGEEGHVQGTPIESLETPSTPDAAQVTREGMKFESSDIDGDSVIDGLDNCPTVTNPEQLDTDQDEIGDACDES